MHWAIEFLVLLWACAVGLFWGVCLVVGFAAKVLFEGIRVPLFYDRN